MVTYGTIYGLTTRQIELYFHRNLTLPCHGIRRWRASCIHHSEALTTRTMFKDILGLIRRQTGYAWTLSIQRFHWPRKS